MDQDKLVEEITMVMQQLDEVLKDIEWRKPDVEAEEAKLAELREEAVKNPGVDVATQAVVVRVLRAVLDDKIAEAEKLEKRMLELKAQIEGLGVASPITKKRVKRGKAIREAP